jgi:hypothetical protein
LDNAHPQPPRLEPAPQRMIMFPPLGTGQIEQWEMAEVPAPPQGRFRSTGSSRGQGEDGAAGEGERVLPDMAVTREVAGFPVVGCQFEGPREPILGVGEVVGR